MKLKVAGVILSLSLIGACAPFKPHTDICDDLINWPRDICIDGRGDSKPLSLNNGGGSIGNPPGDDNGGVSDGTSDDNDNGPSDSNGDNSDDRGHGNDDDRHDDDNPGKGKGKGRDK